MDPLRIPKKNAFHFILKPRKKNVSQTAAHLTRRQLFFIQKGGGGRRGEGKEVDNQLSLTALALTYLFHPEQ